MEVMGPDGRYELRTQLGKGTRGTVYYAVDLPRRLPVIVRRFDKAIPNSDLAKYAQVSAAIGRAKIPAAVTPYEVVITSEPAPFEVFIAHDGEILESRLHGDGFQWVRAVKIVASCAETIAAVHAATGEIHGALKPSNLWIKENGDTLVLGFGIAGLRPLGPVRRGMDFFREYRAPEQLDGLPPDARADVFALGVLLVELTTGIHPFSGSTAFQAAHKLTQPSLDLAEVTRGMSVGGARDVAKFVTRALASKPEERHADVRAFATALAYVRGIVGAPAPSLPRRVAALPSPLPPDPSIADPTTILRLPNLRDLFNNMPPPTRAAAETPVEPLPAEPATQERTLPIHLAPVATRMPALSQTAPADSTERDFRPRIEGDATQALPQAIPIPTSNDEKTDIIHSHTTRTERAFCSRIDDDATQALPQIAPKPAPSSDDMATIALPVRVVLPRQISETTMILPEISGQAYATADPATIALAEHASRSKGSAEPPSARLQWILIGVNICVLFVLIGLAWSAMR